MSITLGELHVSKPFTDMKVLDVSYSVEPNEHMRAEVVLECSQTVDQRLMYSVDTPVSIRAGENIILTGIIENVEIRNQQKYQQVYLKLIGMTSQLDQKRKCKSFQRATDTYQNIITKTANATNTLVQCNMEDISIGMPIIQYQETDWQFILRVGSGWGKAVYTREDEKKPVIYVGMPERERSRSIYTKEYEVGCSESFYQRAKGEVLRNKIDYLYYEVERTENLYLGQAVKLNNIEFRVCKKRAYCDRGELIFQYILGKEQLVANPYHSNELFAGMSILGKVIEVSKETVKIHLDIDQTQNQEEAYAYNWVPESGSSMYCMPKVGARVSLYFKNAFESSAEVVNCIRENGESCSAMSNTDNRYLTTENDKQMYLKPQSAGFVSEKAGMGFGIEDETGIHFESQKEFVICAGEKIHLKGKNVSLETPNLVKLVRG